MTEEDEYRGKEWSLGNDDYCETCGSSWNMAEFDPDWHDPNAWMFSYRVGCYGGASVSYNDEDREEKVEDMLKYLQETYPGWSGRLSYLVRHWIKECDQTRELVTIPPQIFKVSQEDWEQLNKALNEPPKESEGLKRLFGLNPSLTVIDEVTDEL